MIDLRKPLEGVPGLLLMAALILFGAGIGIAFALGFTWIPMSDALANFLGGVVGAGLGAALAVLGAVYVQRREARERVRKPLNQIANGFERLLVLLTVIRSSASSLQEGRQSEEKGTIEAYVGAHIAELKAMLERLPDGEELSRDLHNDVLSAKAMLRAVIRGWEYVLAMTPVTWPINASYFQLLDLAADHLTALLAGLPHDAAIGPPTRAAFAAVAPRSWDTTGRPSEPRSRAG